LAQTTGLPVIVTGTTIGSVTVPTWVAQSVSGIVPSTASVIFGCGVISSSGGAFGILAPNNSYGAYNSTSNPPPFLMKGDGSGSQSIITQFQMVLESTNVYYANQTGAANVYCSGWEDNI